MSAAGANGTALPTPDTDLSTYSMAAAGGQTLLINGTAFTGSGNVAGDAALVDMVGVTGSNTYEGAAAGVSATPALTVNRTAGADTDNNNADFTTAAPTPTNSGGTTDPEPPGDPVDATIAEIQGTGATSPLADQLVKTSGVVTAAFPTGGFNGFYIQTPGADTPDASDGVFVYQPGFTGIAVGDSVEVVGTAKEFSGQTQVEIGTTGTVTKLDSSLGTVTPKTVIPGTDCALPGTDCLTGAALEAAREKSEGELFKPAGDYTVTDAYDGSAFNPPASASSNFFGEIGLAGNTDAPLVTPTEVVDAQDSAGIAARVAYNNAHRVVLDDGSSTTYWNTANTAAMDQPLPWHTTDNYVRVGAEVTFAKPVVLDYRFGWKVQPTRQIVGSGAEDVAFAQDRSDAPEEVGGDLTLATFNVLNYFTTLGADYGGCTSYKDRAGNPIAVNQCPGDGPRGAWDNASFQRQQGKIVDAIGKLDADIVSVEEIENSAKVDGGNRDEAIGALVAALNADAGSTRWAYAASPTGGDLPALADEDVIRTGFLYNPDTVELVGTSKSLVGSAPFSNAREPLAQAFKAKGGDDGDAFGVIVNHFKSKGCSGATGDNTADSGQGCYNGDRNRQAAALAGFADDFAADRGIEAVFLTGDFNSYSMEDPMQSLDDGGYANLASDTEGEYSYNFDGQVGSLDHVVANDAAADLVAGVDIWESNANETVFRQYSRFNYNVTQLFEDNQFSASDHNPEVIGIDVPDIDPEPVDSTTTVTADATSVPVLSGTTTVTATVAAEGETPTGDVEFVVDGTSVDTVALSDGAATLDLGPFDSVGVRSVEARYLGSATVAESNGQAAFEVVKRTPAMKVTKKPAKVVVKKTKATVTVKLTAAGGPVTGKVQVTVAGKKYNAKVAKGKAVVKLKKFTKVGSFKTTVKFLGSATDKPVTKTMKIKVVKR